ncbi:MAG TPA: TetR family transcriptional regulator [Gaiellales bacterium]|nr:TetR family transcriptional regulator [Gaiellales bacterium]
MTRNRSDTVSALLDAAAAVLAARGMRALTTRSVAARAGVAPGVVHYQLGSVQGLTARLCERQAAERIARAQAIWAADASLADRLRGWLSMGERDAAEGRARVWRELCAAAWSDPELAALVRAADAASRAAVAAALDRSAAASGIPERATGALATAVVALDAGLEVQRLVGSTGGHEDLRLWVEAGLRALEGGSR